MDTKASEDTQTSKQSENLESVVDVKTCDLNVNTAAPDQEEECKNPIQPIKSCESGSQNESKDGDEENGTNIKQESVFEDISTSVLPTCESQPEKKEYAVTPDSKLSSDGTVSLPIKVECALENDTSASRNDDKSVSKEESSVEFKPPSHETTSVTKEDALNPSALETTSDNGAIPKLESRESVPSPTPNTSVLIKSEKNDTEDTQPETLETTADESKASSLSLLAAQYDSSSDSDEVYEVPSNQTYQNRVVEIDSDTSSDSDVEVVSDIRGVIDLEQLCGNGDDDEEDNIRNSRSPKVKGELHLEDLPPIQDLHITVPEEECTQLGSIQSIIEQLVIVNSLPGTVPLDLDTVLFLNKGRQVLGTIFDVLGQVSDPLYCIRFNSNKEIKEKGIEVGQPVYVAPRTQHTQFIVLANLMKERGSDASWENDIEPPERYLDYSDDEEERSARRSIRNKNRPSEGPDDAPKRQRPAEARGGHSYNALPTGRPHRGNFHGQPPRQPHYQHPGNYNIAGNSWHSNYYTQNYGPPPQQYRMPMHSPNRYRPPQRNIPQRVPSQSGMVLNPYAVMPPPPLMQQPVFPPHLQHPPPPPPGSQ